VVGVLVGGKVPPPDGDPAAGALPGVEGVISPFISSLSFFGAVSPLIEPALSALLPCAQRELSGDRSQRIFMIAGDSGFSEGVDWAKLRILMVVRANPAAIKLKIVFAVVFIGNIPNSSLQPLCGARSSHLLDANKSETSRDSIGENSFPAFETCCPQTDQLGLGFLEMSGVLDIRKKI
jgi:hypothetical protein